MEFVLVYTFQYSSTLFTQHPQMIAVSLCEQFKNEEWLRPACQSLSQDSGSLHCALRYKYEILTLY